MKEDLFFMEKALKQAQIAFENDEVPIGAVIVKDNRVVACGYNQVEQLFDPTAHAEIIAITSAAAQLRSKWLTGSTLYVTVEPCCMCAGAIILSRIERLVFGCFDPKTGAFGSKLDINSLKLNHRIKVAQGVMRQDCADLLKVFFKNKRAAAKLKKS